MPITPSVAMKGGSLTMTTRSEREKSGRQPDENVRPPWLVPSDQLCIDEQRAA